MFCRAECWQYDERYHWTGLGLNSISNSIREIEKFNQGWKYRSAITIYIDQYRTAIYNNPLYFSQILLIGKMFWKQSLSWNKYSERWDLNFNQLSPGVFAEGLIEELNNFFNLTQNLRSDFSWSFGLNLWSIIQSLHWSSGFQCCLMALWGWHNWQATNLKSKSGLRSWKL